jgi:transposase, IS30 family
MSYRQVTRSERYFISGALAKGFSKTFIAHFLKRHRSTIHREIERNKDSKGHYKYLIAHGTAKNRLRVSRRKSYFPEAVWTLVKSNIKKEWAPEQVVGKLARTGDPTMHWGTIYREIKRDRRKGGRLFKHLRQANKKRRKGYGRPDSRGVLRGKRNISERPKAANERSELGHCEADLVRGFRAQGWVLTLIDRNARLVRIRKLRGKSVAEVNRKLIPILRDLGVKTVTVDNGCEFHGYKDVETATGALFYFANPHRSWERGSVENMNGLIRQYLPKSMALTHLTQSRCNFIEKRLNERPRKLLNFRTPEECYYGQ